MRLVTAVLVAVLTYFLGATWGFGQSSPALPTILSGPDIGFRVQSRNGETPIGILVVRVDGKWVPAQFASGVKPLTSK